MSPPRRLKVLRVVTTPECVTWHMGKTLQGLSEEFDVTVAGEDVSRHRASFPGVSFVDLDMRRKPSPFSDLRALFQLVALCRRLRPDVAHSIMPKAGLLTALATRIAGVPVRIHTFTGQVWDTKAGLPRLVLKLLDRLVVALNTVCLTDSPSQSRHLQANGITLHGRPLPVLGQGSLIGVDLERFDRERIVSAASVTRGSLGFDPSHFVIAYVARKSKDKGALDMITAFARARSRAPHMRLLFVGPDESNGELDRLRGSAPELFVSVIERGTVSNHEEYLAASDVLCMPSYREGFGSVVIDAAALGVPCVGSRIVGLVDSVAEGSTGLLFEAGDTDSLAELLLRLDQDRDLLAQLGGQARARVKRHFSSETMTRHLIDFYRDALEQTGKFPGMRSDPPTAGKPDPH